MQASAYPKPAGRTPAVIYTTSDGQEGVYPIRKLFNRDELIDSLRNSPGVVRIEEAFVDEPGWRSGNAMALGTGNRAYERNAYLVTGNIIGGTMLGYYVRPRAEKACNGKSFRPGELQGFDLKIFEQPSLHAGAMTEFIRRDTRFDDQKCIAYVIFHTARKKVVVHGALITDTNGRLVRLFQRPDLGLNAVASSAVVMGKARHFLTDERISDRKTIWTLH